MNDEHLAGLVAGIGENCLKCIMLIICLTVFTRLLAESATNPGWDIKILDADGNVNDVYR